MIWSASSRKVATAFVTFVLSLTCISALASRLDGSPTALAALQVKADKAQPRDKCFLYAELVSQMTNLAGQQFNAGDSERATETLKQVQWYAEKIHAGVPDNSNRLIDAELLMRHTSLRLSDILHVASEEDRPTLEVTLKQLNQVHTQLLTLVFEK
jgi:phosphoenolpyruvate synthase/pyruvate phosphate dikinase